MERRGAKQLRIEGIGSGLTSQHQEQPLSAQRAPSSDQPASLRIERRFKEDADAVLYAGDCLDFLKTLPDQKARLIVTSPPYNIGKQYERPVKFEKYLEDQEKVIRQCARVLAKDGSICWQVGNFVGNN